MTSALSAEPDAAAAYPGLGARRDLRVYDAGYERSGMFFRAVIGAPEVIRVAHHRDARGIVDLLNEDESPNPDLWDVRSYERHGDPEAFEVRYEPLGWQTLTEEELDRRAHLSRRPGYFGIGR